MCMWIHINPKINRQKSNVVVQETPTHFLLKIYNKWLLLKNVHIF